MLLSYLWSDRIISEVAKRLSNDRCTNLIRVFAIFGIPFCLGILIPVRAIPCLCYGSNWNVIAFRSLMDGGIVIRPTSLTILINSLLFETRDKRIVCVVSAYNCWLALA